MGLRTRSMEFKGGCFQYRSGGGLAPRFKVSGWASYYSIPEARGGESGKEGKASVSPIETGGIRSAGAGETRAWIRSESGRESATERPGRPARPEWQADGRDGPHVSTCDMARCDAVLACAGS